MIISDYIAAIISLRPDADFTLHDSNNLDTLEWITCVDPPSIEEIILEQKRLQNEAELFDYQIKRRFEYPNIGDQLDALYHAGVFPTDMAEQIRLVKEKYPKP
jgi:hypothetical protein